jgi:hypothetical protein
MLNEISFMWRKDELDLVQFTYAIKPIYMRNIEFISDLKIEFHTLIDEVNTQNLSPPKVDLSPSMSSLANPTDSLANPTDSLANPTDSLANPTDSLFTMTYITYTEEGVQREIGIDIPRNTEQLIDNNTDDDGYGGWKSLCGEGLTATSRSQRDMDRDRLKLLFLCTQTGEAVGLQYN